MNITRNYKTLIAVIALVICSPQNAKASNECFEKTSRAIFNFNMALDDIFLNLSLKGTINYLIQ